ncbi:MAG: polysaccharide biosynthesis C-terminal domain-containing protein, partial [Clostridia bacterium]|nr:polysaccharide biosynthesis C-terminal domain-containing protein [Clostridia bacterium]
ANGFFPFKEFIKICWKYALSATVMFIGVATMAHFLPENLLWLVAEIATGIIVYFTLLLLFRTEFLLNYLKNLFSKRKRRNR